MALKTIMVKREVLINLGDFQNEKVGVEVTYEPEPDETPMESHAVASATAEAMLRAEIDPILEGVPPFRRNAILKTFGVGAESATE